MNRRVTDLEKFHLEQIWWPFQTIFPHADIENHALKKAPYSMEETARFLGEKNRWSEVVLDRITKIGFTFPDYFVHPLVDVVRAASAKEG